MINNSNAGESYNDLFKEKINKLYKVIYIHSLKQYSIIFFNRVCSTLFMLD